MLGAIRRGAIILITTFALSQPAVSYAQAAAPAPESIAQSFFAKLKAGQVQQAVSGYFADGMMERSKPQEFRMLVDQISTAMTIYGPVAECELVETSKRGTIVESRLYVCQHEHLVTRWIFQMIRTTQGWTGGNLGFDDRFTLPLDAR